MEKVAYLALGANIGNREENMRAAVRMLRGGGCAVTAVSSLYLTKPLGVTDQPDFANAVIEVRTFLTPRELLDLCLDVESQLGRVRTIRWGPRVIDVDVLIYGDVTMDEKELVLPHPRMLERAFVLVPLAEIAPDLLLCDGRTAREAADQIDKTGIEKLTDQTWSD